MYLILLQRVYKQRVPTRIGEGTRCINDVFTLFLSCSGTAFTRWHYSINRVVEYIIQYLLLRAT